MALTDADYLKMLDDPNAFAPLYGGTLEAGTSRLNTLNDINQWISSFDPNKDLNDAYTPEVMASIGEQLKGYIGAQTSYDQALQAQKNLDLTPKLPTGYSSTDMGLDAANKAIGMPVGKYTLENYRNELDKLYSSGGSVPGYKTSKDAANAFRTTFDNTASYWNNDVPALLSKNQGALTQAQIDAAKGFVAPSAMADLQKNRLGLSLNAIGNQTLKNAQSDIFNQAWAAKRGVTEQSNRLGILGGGGRRFANQGVDRTAIGAYGDASSATKSDIADRMSAFNQSMEDARQQTANLEADVKNRGFAALADQSTQGQIDAFGRSLSTATSDALSGAQQEFAQKQKKDQLFGDIFGMVGNAAGSIGSSFLPIAPKVY